MSGDCNETMCVIYSATNFRQEDLLQPRYYVIPTNVVVNVISTEREILR